MTPYDTISTTTLTTNMSSLDLGYYELFHQYAVLGDKRWHYLDIPPTSPSPSLLGAGKTLLLCHGFPDSWYGWRKQIPVLRGLGYRLLVPSQMGYTRSEAPLYPTPEPNEKGEYPELGLESGPDALKDLYCYTGKFYAQCMDQLLTQLGVATVTIIGHDYGAYLGPKLYLYYPHRVEAMATSCWHYVPALKKFYPIPEFIKVAPSLSYQAYLIGEASKDFSTRKGSEDFLRNVFGGNGWGGDDALHMTEQEFQNYMTEFAKGGRFCSYMVSTYKARRLTFEIEQNDFAGRTPESMQADVPYLHIGAEQDMAFRPPMIKSLRRFVKPGRLTEVWIDASHWLMFEKPDEFNRELVKWLEGLAKAQGSKI